MRTAIPNASQNFTNSAALRHPLAVRHPSNSSDTFPSSSYTVVLLATAPTVIPFKRINPVTMSFAKSLFVSKKIFSSARIDNASAGSAAAFSRSTHTRLRSSVPSSYASLSSLFAGKRHTNERISSMTSPSVPTISMIPLSLLWKAALDVSHFLISLFSIVFGELTKSFPVCAINVKSVIAAAVASPPPQFPKIAVICGITPEAMTCL